MVSKPIADYAVGPDLIAAVFLVRADKKTRIFFPGLLFTTHFLTGASYGRAPSPWRSSSSKNIVAKKAPPAATGATSFV